MRIGFAGVLALVVSAGCASESTAPAGQGPLLPSGEAGGAGATTDPNMVGNVGGAGAVMPTDPDACAASPDEAPLRLLTREEYNNTLRDLLGVMEAPLELPTAAEGKGFDNAANRLGANPALVEAYLNIAETVSAQLNISDLVQSVGACYPDAAGQNTCAGQFIDAFGVRAYRRPVPEEEKTSLLADVFEQGRSNVDFDEGIRWVITTMLQSPYFLYRLEEGVARGDGVSVLDNYEVASRLSYFLTGSMPDTTLFDAAAAGELATAEQIGAQAERLLDTDVAHESIAHMHRQWFKLDKIPELTKDADLFGTYDAVRTDLTEQTLGYLDHLVFQGGTVHDIFDNDHVLVNRALAEFYTGEQHPDLGDEMEWVESAPLGMEDRRGVLLMGAFLSINAHAQSTSPVHRGRFVREQVLCQKLPDPPNNVPALVPPDETANVRTRLDQHRTDPVCASCHTLMDPVGYAFEHYDAVGLYRDNDEVGPVDASGEVVGFGDANTTLDIDGAESLITALADAPTVSECVTQRWMQYALGRDLKASDACNIETVYAAAQNGQGTLREILVAITESDVFRMRTTPDTQGACQ